MMRKIAILVCLAGLLISAVSGAEAVSYTITDLGTLDGYSWYPAAINNRGQVVGYFNNPAGYWQAVLWQNGTITDLGRGQANAINNNGQIVGEFLDGLNGTMETPGVGASGINDIGQVIGGDSNQHACLWQNDVVTDLGTLPGGSWSTASGINNSGQVVGYSDAGGGNCHAFLWQNGTMTDLGTLPGCVSYAYAINNNGQVVGSSGDNHGDWYAWLWQNGTFTYLDPAVGGSAIGINNEGQVACSNCVLWQNCTITYLPGGGGAIGINDSGQVVGTAETAPGIYNAVLWTPVPEPEYGISNKAAYDPIISTASGNFSFKVWGKVTILGADSFTLDDGSGMPVTVTTPGESGDWDGDYAFVTGKFSGEGSNRVLNAQTVGIVEQN